MEDEVVVQRKWLSRQHFLDLVGAANLIPGPNSTEMIIHNGHIRAGWPGLKEWAVPFLSYHYDRRGAWSCGQEHAMTPEQTRAKAGRLIPIIIVEAVRFLNDVLERMHAHQHKRRSMLRKLSVSEPV